MAPNNPSSSHRDFASRALAEAWQDFTLSRQAMNCTRATMVFYHHTARRFLLWAEEQGLTSLSQLTAKHVRGFLACLKEAGRADNTLHDNARAIRTLLRFFHAEGYMGAIQFQMPHVAEKRLPVLTASELERLIAACDTPRDKALVMFLADTGLRRAELCALNWEDVDYPSGLVRVKRGKCGKARSVVISPSTRRALLKYGRNSRQEPTQPVFLTRTRTRITGETINLLFIRLRKQTGIHVTAHALRRTFATLSLRAGIDVLHLQALLGHGSLSMVSKYTRMVEDDLLTSHRAYSPIENLSRLAGGETHT